MSKRTRAALMEIPVMLRPTLIDGRTIAGLERLGLVESRLLMGLDGRTLAPLPDGRRWPRRVKLVKLTRLGRMTRDFFHARAARALDRELRERNAGSRKNAGSRENV